MSNHPFFNKLFKHSEQVTPYLQGQLTPADSKFLTDPIIHINRSSSKNISDLYETLKQLHPEAGAPYWLTRTWDLLCWQPIYVAFIAIYHCRGLPKLSLIAQEIHSNYISGYHFYSAEFTEGNERELIALAGKELNVLFDYFRHEIGLWSRIRPGFTNHLFADAILGCLIRISNMKSHFCNETILEHGKLWLKACNLPEKSIMALKIDEESNQFALSRTSCCLAYKCDGHALCQDCPRQVRLNAQNAR